MKFIHIEIQPLGDLESTAGVVGSVLGLSFVEDKTGLYDEFPAYVAERDGLRYALLGVPEPGCDVREEPSNDFELLVQPLRRDPPKSLDQTLSQILDKINADGRIRCAPKGES